MLSDPFKAAAERADADAMAAALADDVVFRSPVVFRPYQGHAVVSTILVEGAFKVFEGFRYTDRFEAALSAVLVFEARVGDREVQGVDLLRFNGEGKVCELTVIVRPMSGLVALAEAMGREFERLGIAPPGD
jgi:hypothetical protein